MVVSPPLIDPAGQPLLALAAFARIGAGLWLTARALVVEEMAPALRLLTAIGGLGLVFAPVP
jgi:hypothetical protein